MLVIGGMFLFPGSAIHYSHWFPFPSPSLLFPSATTSHSVPFFTFPSYQILESVVACSPLIASHPLLSPPLPPHQISLSTSLRLYPKSPANSCPAPFTPAPPPLYTGYFPFTISVQMKGFDPKLTHEMVVVAGGMIWSKLGTKI